MKKIFSFLFFLVFTFFLIPHSKAQSLAPENAVTKKYAPGVLYLPADFSCGVSWAQALTLTNGSSSTTASIIIDYIAVYQIDGDGNATLVDMQNYDNENEGELSGDLGGLYWRSPWYGGNDTHTGIAESYVCDGKVTLYVGKRQNRVFHFWGNRFYAEKNTDYAIKMRCKINEDCVVSVGFDWWREFDSPWAGLNKNNCQAFCSEWFGKTEGYIEIWQKIKQ